MRSSEQVSSVAKTFGDRAAEAEKLIGTYEGFEKESVENARLNTLYRTAAFSIAVVVGCVQHRQNVDLSVIIATQTITISLSVGGSWALSRIGKSIRRDMYDAFANLESLIPKDKLLTARAALEEAGIHGEGAEHEQSGASSTLRSIAQEIGEKLAPYLAAFFG